MFLQLIFTSVLNPKLLNLSRSILKNSELQFIPSLFKEKQFNDTVEGLTIFVDTKNANGIYKNIFIRDDGGILSRIGTVSSTIIAKSGYVSKNEKNLILYNGNIQRLEKDGSINIFKFQKTELNISGMSTGSISAPKIQETSTIQILQCMTNIKKTRDCDKSKKTLMDTKIEINKRFGMPIYIPLISLIACFLLASRKDKKMFNLNKYIYFFIAFAILTFAEIIVRYSGISWNHTIIYYSIPLGMFPFIYLFLIRVFKYENLS
tara:strand:- start:427 stop:1215 length:789 start_codon:yes stop_codon:yes gene_type:complete